MDLTKRERAILEFLAERGGFVQLNELQRSTNPYAEGDEQLSATRRARRYRLAFEQLSHKGLIETSARETSVRLTSRGNTAASERVLPVREMLQALSESEAGKLSRTALKRDEPVGALEGMELDIAYALKRKWIVQTVEGDLSITHRGSLILSKPDEKNEFHALRELLLQIQEEAGHAQDETIRLGEPGNSEERRRQQHQYALARMGLISQSQAQRVSLTPAGREALSQKHTALTVQDLRSRTYRTEGFRLAAINLERSVQPTFPGKEATATGVLRSVRQSFAQLGFEEYPVTPVELVFWNFDLLLLPPTNPERDRSRIYRLDETMSPPMLTLPDDIYERWYGLWTREIDAGGLDFEYPDPRRSARLMLRTHVTPASIHLLATLADTGQLAGECRRFAIGRVYSPAHADEIDLHAEGLMVEGGASMLSLVRVMMELLARVPQLHSSNLAIKSACYPYTAPSITIVDRQLNSCLGAGGMIRPEILEILGVDLDRYLAAGFAVFLRVDNDGNVICGHPLPGDGSQGR